MKITDKFGFFYMLGFFVVLGLVFSGVVHIEESLRDTANVLTGVLATGLIKILDFRYGSSLGSKQKTAALAAQKVEK